MLMGPRRACSPHPSPVVRREACHAAITRRWDIYGETTGRGLGNRVPGGLMTATLLAANAVAWIALAIALVTVR